MKWLTNYQVKFRKNLATTRALETLLFAASRCVSPTHNSMNSARCVRLPFCETPTARIRRLPRFSPCKHVDLHARNRWVAQGHEIHQFHLMRTIPCGPCTCHAKHTRNCAIPTPTRIHATTRRGAPRTRPTPHPVGPLKNRAGRLIVRVIGRWWCSFCGRQCLRRGAFRSTTCRGRGPL